MPHIIALVMAASRLPVIVKLSGSFAAGGLLFSELNSDTVEGLPSLKNLLLPTQAHAFSFPTFKLKSAPPRPRVQPYIALDDSGKCVKVSLQDGGDPWEWCW